MTSLHSIIGGADGDPAKGPSFTGGDGEQRPVNGRARHFAQRRAIAVESLIGTLKDATSAQRCQIRVQATVLYPTLREHAFQFLPDGDNFHRGRQKICSCALFNEMIANVLVSHAAPDDTFDSLCESLDNLDIHPVVEIICADDAAIDLQEIPFGSPQFLPLLRKYLGEDLPEPPRKALANPLVVGQLSAENLEALVREELAAIAVAELWEAAFARKAQAGEK